MKKILISVGVVIVVALVAVFFSHSNTPSITPGPITSTTTPITQPTTTAGGNPPQTGQYKDGSYTGPVADAIYGQLQVVAVVQGGRLTDVQFPQYPNAPGHTTEVSQSALPTLKQEAIAAQSAQVNIVSGATQTSQAFQQSLTAALAMAK